jgi:heme exporter protein B
MEAIVLPVFIALFDLQIANPAIAIAAVTLGNTGFVIVASSLSILVIKSKSRELLIPVIIFPIIFPIISSTILALSLSIEGTNIAEVKSPLIFIASFSVVMLTVAILTSDYAFTD